MPAVVSGFKNLRKRQEKESEQRMTGDFIEYMRLRDDGDIVRFRIVSEYEEETARERGLSSTLISATFHRHEAMSSKGRSYFTTTVCSKTEDADGNLHGECKLCTEEVARSLQFMVWVWVYDYYHLRQNEDVNKPWQAAMLGQMHVYKESVNRFMIWQDGWFSSQALEGRINRYGSITDRDYERARHGARGDTQTKYELTPQEPAPISGEVLEKSKTLPDLMAVAMGETRTMDGKPNEDRMRRDSNGSGAHERVAVPSAADDSPPWDDRETTSSVTAEDLSTLPF